MTAPHRHRRAATRTLLSVAIAVLAVSACSRAAETGSTGTQAPSSTASGSATSAPTTAAPKPFPGGTAFPGAPTNACDLLTEDDITVLTRFKVIEGPAGFDDAATNKIAGCAWRNAKLGFNAGSVTLTPFGPDHPLDNDRAVLTDIVNAPELGGESFYGHYDKGFGDGPNVIVVDKGNGGFTILASVTQTLTPDELKQLAQTAASRWG